MPLKEVDTRLLRALSEYRAFVSALAIETGQRSLIRDIILSEPSTTSAKIMKAVGISAEELVKIYRDLQTDEEFQLAVNSPYYSRRLMFNVARTVVHDLASDSDYTQRLISGDPVSSRVVELHTTKGTCNYNCVMCLWSDKGERTYDTAQMKGFGLMQTEEWKNTLATIREFGTKVAVFSGGGEVLLNKDFFRLLAFSHSVGLKTQLYTSGYNMTHLEEEEWGELLNMDRIRFSIHSSNEGTYNDIVSMPEHAHALTKVDNNLKLLLEKRNIVGSDLKIGIGFVIQPLNTMQVEDIVEFAKRTGVDYLNIRRDEILVTNPLDQESEVELRKQLLRIRQNIVNGVYGNLEIDFSDNLVAFMNEEKYLLPQVPQCVIKHFRPTINPYGLWNSCDLKGEPMYADPDFVIGDLHQDGVVKILARTQQTTIPAACTSCMPSGQTGNAIFTKLLQDHALGIDFKDQPFF
ncbi:MAG: radical SAM protein [Pseudomonadales bacterium]|nr:radical SAM protein [Pseudomonadales bacterium]